MKRIRPLLVATIAAGFLATAAIGYAQSWRLAGSSYVTRSITTRTMLVNKNAHEVRRIKLRALNAPIKIWKLTIYFDNGDVQEWEHRPIIGKNRDSDEIDLDGGNRTIKRIRVRSNAVSFSKKSAVLWLYAHK